MGDDASATPNKGVPTALGDGALATQGVSALAIPGNDAPATPAVSDLAIPGDVAPVIPTSGASPIPGDDAPMSASLSTLNGITSKSCFRERCHGATLSPVGVAFLEEGGDPLLHCYGGTEDVAPQA